MYSGWQPDVLHQLLEGHRQMDKNKGWVMMHVLNRVRDEWQCYGPDCRDVSTGTAIHLSQLPCLLPTGNHQH
jgi:hypothetical protein